MKYILDTNICIYAINGRYPRLTEHLLATPPDDISVSAISVGELEYGASKSRWGEQTRQIMHAFLASFAVLPFSEEDAIVFGRLRALLAMERTPIGILDLMIASQGLSRDLSIVTHNTRGFIRVPGILIEDWVE